MIFCSSQFPFYCSPTCPLLVVAMLLCSSSMGTGLGAVTFLSFLLESGLSKSTHILTCGERLRLGQWAGPGLGKGQAALPSAGCQSGCSLLPF